MFLRRPLTDEDIETGRQATAALSHRGPDADGEWFDRDAGVYLGHRRLTVIDLSDASNQPMTLGDLVLTYNGEIYNYRDLRQRLDGLGHDFQTSGDTEVLLQAWRRFGTDSVDEFDGMFGFALWDGRSGWLSVDRFAEKQIYVASTHNGIIAASELPSLARAVGAKASLSPETVAAFMSLGYVPGPQTAYPAICRMSSATVLKIAGGKIAEERKYWRPPFGEKGRGPLQPIDERGLDRIQIALIESVERRLESDAPICLYLSSGIDSALVGAIAARDLGKSLDTLTVSYPRGATHDESGDAAAIASELGLSHEVIENVDDSDSVTPAFFFDLLGQPSDDLTLVSLNQMATVGAARGYKAAVTGMGGDEVFFGYNKHSFFFNNRRMLNSPEYLRLAMGFLSAPLETISSRVRTFRRVAAVRDHERYLAVKNLPTIGLLRGCPGFETWASKSFARRTGIEIEVPIFEFEGVMTEHRLPSTDTGSMRASIEFRTPYLSRQVQEVVAEFDPRTLLAFGQKSVLRRLLNRYMPGNLVDFPKRGFVFPPDRFGPFRHQHPPTTRLLPTDMIETIWRRRNEVGWRGLAVRVVMLSAFDDWNLDDTVSVPLPYLNRV